MIPIQNTHERTSITRPSWVGGFFIWLALCFTIAGLGGYCTSIGLKGYYEFLCKPDWTPPGYVIGTVWNVLFVMMAIAACLVWRKVGWFHRAIVAFLVQLLLNFGWSYAFFVMQCPEIAFWELCTLWLGILVTAIFFWPISRLATALLIPYLAWVLFAGYLNYIIWQMN